VSHGVQIIQLVFTWNGPATFSGKASSRPVVCNMDVCDITQFVIFRFVRKKNEKNRLMEKENQYALDLHALHLLRLVADHGSFTTAGKRAGLTQSAVPRQVQGLEE